jgi:hypothetical protein
MNLQLIGELGLTTHMHKTHVCVHSTQLANRMQHSAQ